MFHDVHESANFFHYRVGSCGVIAYLHPVLNFRYYVSVLHFQVLFIIIFSKHFS